MEATVDIEMLHPHVTASVSTWKGNHILVPFYPGEQRLYHSIFYPHLQKDVMEYLFISDNCSDDLNL